MRYQKKMNRQEKLAMQRMKAVQNSQGKGLYIYENNIKGDLDLPKIPNKILINGIWVENKKQRMVQAKQQFEGDDYFMQLVRTNQCRLIKEIKSPEKENMEKKLILDQPETVSVKGKVEHVIVQAQKTLKETNSNKKEEILLTEDPIDGVEIILE